MRRNIKDKGYILLTLLFIIVAAGSLFFVNQPLNPKQSLSRVMDEWKEITETQRDVQWFAIANLRSPTPSEINYNVDIDINLVSFVVPSTTPSDALPSVLPSSLGTLSKDQKVVEINRDFVLAGMQKMLEAKQSQPSTP